jgi:predicted RNase H-like nuclease
VWVVWPTVYIGIDLAWSDRNPSGVATLVGTGQDARLVEPPQTLRDDAAILAYVLDRAGTGPAIVAVDAPLCVPNAQGRRLADAELSAAFRSYEAGAHPANRCLLARDSVVRGEWLVEQLSNHGFEYVAGIAAGTTRRLVTEVFPHPALVAIFGLSRSLKYKARPGRSLDQRYQEWQRYQQYLGTLATADPSLSGLDDLLAPDVRQLRGLRLKAYEDSVDAVFCAYIGLYGRRWGAERCRTFGDTVRGSIFTPVPETMWSSA